MSTFAGLQYNGKVSVSNRPYQGTGLFKFALLDDQGKLLWNNDASGSFAAVPTSEVRLSVSNGSYAVTLEDFPGARTLENALTTQSSTVKLRIWFSDGTNGWRQLPPDQVINLKELRTPNQDASVEANVERILSELRQIKVQLTALERRTATPPTGTPTPAAPATPPPPVLAKVTLKSGSHTLGDPKAKLALIEYTDYQCSFCKKFYETTFPQLKAKYIDKGTLLFVSRSFPLDFHTNAKDGAKAAICAGEQNKYFEMRDRLFANSTNIGPSLFSKLIGELQLDGPAFNLCTINPLTGEKVQKDLIEGTKLGINGTPSFVLGRLTPDGQVDGQIIVGAKSFADFENRINTLLTGQK